MMKKLLILSVIFLSAVTQSCRHHDEPKPESTDVNAILLYAVNNNNLASDFSYNRTQILRAADQFDQERDFIYIYAYENGNAMLKQLVYTQEGPQLTVIKNYGSEAVSTTPERIEEVIRDFESLRPASKRTLFLWGHGMGAVNPDKYYRLQSQIEAPTVYSTNPITIEQPDCYAFGGEWPNNQFIDIDQLADAIPDGLFDTIWFDCCYMGSIEVAYQLRNDCKYLVAYPTEIWADGLPYDKVIPFLSEKNYNLVEGAKALYNQYLSKDTAVTVAVMDMSKLPDFEESCKNFLSHLSEKPSFNGVNNYSRLKLKKPNNNIPHPYYDLMGWLKNSDIVTNSELSNEYKSLCSKINNFVIYKASFTRDFNGKPLDLDNYCGLSVYDYNNDGSERDNFYMTLDWYKDVVAFSGWLK